MIPANELRIGNLIRYISTDSYEFVIDIKGSSKIECINNVQITDCEPIPLTEEWLLKFGFVKGGFSKKFSESFYEIAVGGSGLFINPDNGVVWIERNENIFNNPALIQFVHPLQNLYFALTGEELTIKEAATA